MRTSTILQHVIVLCGLTLSLPAFSAPPLPLAPPAAAAAPAQAAARDVSDLLASIIEKHAIPGMVVAIVDGERVTATGVAGVRKGGNDSKVELNDLFHLGSCTKSMTATMIATLVEEGVLKWETTIGEVFTDVTMDAAWKDVRLEHLLTNSSGAPAGLDADGLWGRLWSHTGTPTEQRRTLVEGVLARPPEAAAGEKFIYSNAGFAIAGAMAEKLTGKPWEDLMRERLFKPLGMASAGFGPPGTRDVVDQPRGHTITGVAMEPGKFADNPAAIGPAGTVHSTIQDWAKYVSLHVRGARGQARLVKAETFTRMHTPASLKDGRGGYAMGWGVMTRPWAQGEGGKGRVLTHNGSNNMWFCVTWLAPEKDFAVLIACNKGGDKAGQACDEAAGALIKFHSEQSAAPAK